MGTGIQKKFLREERFHIDKNSGAYRGYRRFLYGFLLLGIIGIVICQIVLYQNAIPEKIQIIKGENTQFDLHVPAMADIYQKNPIAVSAFEEGSAALEAMSQNRENKSAVTSVNLAKPFTLTSKEAGGYVMQVRLFGLIPFKQVEVSTITRASVIPGGEPVGIYVETDGVLVLGTTAITDIDGRIQHPAENIVAKGDYIVAVNGKTIHYKSQLLEQIKKSKTTPMVLTLRRNQQKIKVRVVPVETRKNEEYKCGIWVRDDTQGIGTLTFTTNDGEFGALGHGVSDVDTGELLESQEGKIYQAQISYVIEGSNGSPGELVGSIDYSEQYMLGTIDRNTASGIFGCGGEDLLHYVEGKALPVGMKQEVQTGSAYIQSYVSGKRRTYQIQIEKVNLGADAKSPNMVIRVTDPKLLSLTGGIVQGMSGSPIIQNGKVVGAVTHVFVNDSTKGYGIFLENMLEE